MNIHDYFTLAEKQGAVLVINDTGEVKGLIFGSQFAKVWLKKNSAHNAPKLPYSEIEAKNRREQKDLEDKINREITRAQLQDEAVQQDQSRNKNINPQQNFSAYNHQFGNSAQPGLNNEYQNGDQSNFSDNSLSEPGKNYLQPEYRLNNMQSGQQANQGRNLSGSEFGLKSKVSYAPKSTSKINDLLSQRAEASLARDPKQSHNFEPHNFNQADLSEVVDPNYTSYSGAPASMLPSEKINSYKLNSSTQKTEVDEEISANFDDI